jgi:hypothetical protein
VAWSSTGSVCSGAVRSWSSIANRNSDEKTTCRLNGIATSETSAGRLAFNGPKSDEPLRGDPEIDHEANEEERRSGDHSAPEAEDAPHRMSVRSIGWSFSVTRQRLRAEPDRDG